MMVKRHELLGRLCHKVGIQTRKDPKSPYLSKMELKAVLAWIDTVEEIHKNRKEETT